MNWKEYMILSEKTLSSEFHCGSRVELLLHAVMGALTEIDELFDNHSDNQDITNILEEIGDNFWYISILSREYKVYIDFDIKIESSLADPTEVILNITKKLLKMLDILKKKIYYNKDIDDNIMIRYTNDIISLFMVYANLFDINIQKSLEVNISKLKARYGQAFSSERAINRDLAVERKILEGNG